MRRLYAVALMVVFAGPAFGQPALMPRYGETDAPKTPSDLEGEKRADTAYKRSLSNVPNAQPADPWGNVRSDNAPKVAAKAAPVKRAKPATPAN